MQCLSDASIDTISSGRCTANAKICHGVSEPITSSSAAKDIRPTDGPQMRRGLPRTLDATRLDAGIGGLGGRWVTGQVQYFSAGTVVACAEFLLRHCGHRKNAQCHERQDGNEAIHGMILS